MPAGLTPCPHCRRHVRTSETACPFCARSLRSDPTASARPAATGRFSRAALIALGTTLAACGSTTGGVDAATAQDSPAADAPARTDAPTDLGNVTPPDATTDTGVSDTGTDLGGMLVLYGPAPFDAGMRADVPTDATDAQADATPQGDARTDLGGLMPLYGSPPSRTLDC